MKKPGKQKSRSRDTVGRGGFLFRPNTPAVSAEVGKIRGAQSSVAAALSEQIDKNHRILSATTAESSESPRTNIKIENSTTTNNNNNGNGTPPAVGGSAANPITIVASDSNNRGRTPIRNDGRGRSRSRDRGAVGTAGSDGGRGRSGRGRDGGRNDGRDGGRGRSATTGHSRGRSADSRRTDGGAVGTASDSNSSIILISIMYYIISLSIIQFNHTTHSALFSVSFFSN